MKKVLTQCFDRGFVVKTLAILKISTGGVTLISRELKNTETFSILDEI